jgi:hypothetical protein
MYGTANSWWPQISQGADSPTHLLVIPSRTQVQPTTSSPEAQFANILAFTSLPYGGLPAGEIGHHESQYTSEAGMSVFTLSEGISNYLVSIK